MSSIARARPLAIGLAAAGLGWGLDALLAPGLWTAAVAGGLIWLAGAVGQTPNARDVLRLAAGAGLSAMTAAALIWVVPVLAGLVGIGAADLGAPRVAAPLVVAVLGTLSWRLRESEPEIPPAEGGGP